MNESEEGWTEKGNIRRIEREKSAERDKDNDVEFIQSRLNYTVEYEGNIVNTVSLESQN